jgi:putative addiction module component (TIGR02574 family)
MTESEIFRESMALPPETKAKLATQLLESLDGPEQGEIDASWALEIEARIAALNAGQAVTIPADQVFAELEARRRKP